MSKSIKEAAEMGKNVELLPRTTEADRKTPIELLSEHIKDDQQKASEEEAHEEQSDRKAERDARSQKSPGHKE